MFSARFAVLLSGLTAAACFDPTAPPAECAAAPTAGVIFGEGSAFSSTPAPTAGGCCALCASDSRCAAWTHHSNGSRARLCFLQASTLPLRPDPTASSGRINGRFDGWNACTGDKASLRFCDASLSQHERLVDLVGRVKLEEAPAQLTARQSPSVPRLGLPAYYWGTNAIHGLQNLDCLPTGACPTSFPAPVALAAAFNLSLVRGMGAVIGRELRAYYHAGEHDSLDTWSPTINVNRDPRWGRNVESPGEDPYVCGAFGAAYSRGLQEGVDPTVRQATVTLKHWLAYSIENYKGVTRHNVDVKVSAYDLSATYLRPFEAAVVEGRAAGVMCSYNMLNGKPTCGNPALNALLRDDWGFDGYITSDTDACGDIWKSHHYEPTAEKAVRDCLEGGTDIDSGSTYLHHMVAAVNASITTRALVDQALYRTYKSRFELGLFDPLTPNAYRHIPTSAIGSQPHQRLSAEAAAQALVLLQNHKRTLPFTPKTTAVIGRAAIDPSAYTGNYNGPLCPGGGAGCWDSLCKGVAKVVPEQVVVCQYNVSDVAGAVLVAAAAEQVVLVLDNALDGGHEALDRESISLAAAQLRLAKAVLKVGKPTALVLFNGGIIGIDELVHAAPAILEAFMPGVHAAEAVAKALFGLSNPGGKLPVTYYPSAYIDQVDFLNMSMQAGPGRSYRYYNGVPIYPFAFGLSYTTFELAWSPSSPPASVLRRGAQREFEVTVTNTGTVKGDEVVLAYVVPRADTFTTLPRATPMEKRRLFGFERVGLDPGASKKLKFVVGADELTLADVDGHVAWHSGEFGVVFSRGHGTELEADVTLDVGEQPVTKRRFTKWW